LHDRLAVLDPEAAKHVEPRNVRRTIRALEVIFHTGIKFSEQQKRGIKRYRNMQLGLTRPREEIYQRIDARIEYMFSAGWIKEVKSLLDRGVNPETPSLSAIGYSEIIAYLRGELTLEKTITLIKRKTRQFVRRQANWFKVDDPEIHWFQVNPSIVNQLETKVHEFLREI
jgi:tRNA dimethylallyltransferase